MLNLDSKPTSCSATITIVGAALLSLGMVMVFSASASLTALPIWQDPLKNSAVRQAAFSGIGLITLLLVSLCPYEAWRIRRGTWWQPSVFLLIAVVGLLVAVLIPGIGEERNGARRWLSLGPSSLGLGFQPSEVAKVGVIIFLSGVCARMGDRVRKFWTGLLPLLFMVAIVGALIGKEDLGTAALVVAVGGCILLAAGARWWHLGLLAIPIVAGLVYLLTVEQYRMDRLLAFRNPELDAQGKSYQPMQSLITIASGGWWGLGLGGGVQKYGYLPEGRSDFIFSVICEELGIIGGLAVIGLFAVLIWQGRKAVAIAPTPFGRLIAFGVTILIGLQAAMNVAVVTVSMPTKGIGLPLVSAGGSGVLFYSFLLGLMANTARYRSVSSAEGRVETGSILTATQNSAPSIPLSGLAGASTTQ